MLKHILFECKTRSKGGVSLSNTLWYCDVTDDACDEVWRQKYAFALGFFDSFGILTGISIDSKNISLIDEHRDIHRCTRLKLHNLGCVA